MSSKLHLLLLTDTVCVFSIDEERTEYPLGEFKYIGRWVYKADKKLSDKAIATRVKSIITNAEKSIGLKKASNNGKTVQLVRTNALGELSKVATIMACDQGSFTRKRPNPHIIYKIASMVNNRAADIGVYVVDGHRSFDNVSDTVSVYFGIKDKK
jgi:hypothetical protein